MARTGLIVARVAGVMRTDNDEVLTARVRAAVSEYTTLDVHVIATHYVESLDTLIVVGKELDPREAARRG